MVTDTITADVKPVKQARIGRHKLRKVRAA